MWLIVLLSLATYRITRFLIDDDLIASPRMWLHLRLMGHDEEYHAVRSKLLYLVQCFYCLSIWVAAALVGIALAFRAVPVPGLTWLAVAGGACVARGIAD